MATQTLVTKNDFRKKVWDHLEKNDLAEFPRPVHNRIPNFKGAAASAHALAALAEFKEAKVVKVNPDKPQETVRFLAMEVEKTVLVPTPRLRHGLFNRLQPPSLAKEELRRVARAEGVRKFSTPIGLENIIPVDLIVVGSVAVSKDGYRIGKGEGYADLEYAMARGAGAVSEDTLVITTVHDDQVFDFLPPELFGEHDLTVDVIVTPTQVIRVGTRHPKPTGIVWRLVTPRKLKAIPILKVLREMEQAAGKDVTLGEPSEEEQAEVSARKNRRLRVDSEPSGGRRRPRRREQGAGDADGHLRYSDADDEAAEKPRAPRRRAAAGRRRRRPTSDDAASDGQEEPELDQRHQAPRRRRRTNPPPPGPDSADEERRAARRTRRDRPPIDHSDGLTVVVRRIPPDARPRDLRDAIAAADSPATILSWKGRQGIALLRLREKDALDHLLAAADGFKLVDELVTLELYDRQRAPPPPPLPAVTRPGRPAPAERRPRQRADRSSSAGGGGGRRPGPRAVSAQEADLTVFIGRLPAATRVRELREALQAAGAAEPSIAWKGRRGMAFVRLKTAEAAEQLVAAADKLKVISEDIVVERYKGRERGDSTAEEADVKPETAMGNSKTAAKPKVAETKSEAPKAEEARVVAVKEGAKPAPVKEVKPAAAKEAKPAVVKEDKPAVVKEDKPAVVKEDKPAAVEVAKPAAVEVAKPAAVEVANSSPVEVSKPSAAEEAKSAAGDYKSKPLVVKEESKLEAVKGDSKPTPVKEDSRPVAVMEESKPAAVKEEPKPAAVKEEPKPAAVKEEPKPAAVKEEPKPAAVEEEPKPAAVKEEPKPAAVKEEPKPAAVKEEPKPAAVKEEPKPAAVKEEPKPAAVKEEPKPAAVKEGPKPAAVKEASKPVTVNEEANADGKLEASAAPSTNTSSAKTDVQHEVKALEEK